MKLKIFLAIIGAIFAYLALAAVLIGGVTWLIVSVIDHVLS